MDIKDVLGTGEAAKEAIKQTGDIIKEPVSNIVVPPTKTIGERLSDILNLVFTPIEVLKIYKDNKIEKFKNKLNEEINAIPEEKRITPPLNVIGPAIEATKFYIDDEELRNMFAKLIVSSMNSDNSSITHPSFVEIIKQLSPLDALNIAFFKKAVGSSIVDYVVKSKDIKYPLLANVSLGLSSCEDIYAISSSITNLIRLGLLEKDMTMCIKTDEKYKDEKILAQVEVQINGTAEQKRNLIDIVDGFIRPTTYGKFFITTCI